MRAFILITALCLFYSVSGDTCNGNNGKNYLTQDQCLNVCVNDNGVGCGCVQSGNRWVCEDVVSQLATWVIIVIVVGTLIVTSPCIICCIGICCCGWFGLRATNRRPVHQVVYAQPVYAQAPAGVTIHTHTASPPPPPGYGYAAHPPPMTTTEANKWQ